MVRISISLIPIITSLLFFFLLLTQSSSSSLSSSSMSVSHDGVQATTTTDPTDRTSPIVRDRVKGLLYGAFIADALAMPAHWYYNTKSLREDVGEVTDYVAPKNPHRESMADGQTYRGSLNIYHDKELFFNLPHKPYLASELEADEHGNRLIKAEKRTHYHNGLPAGANTAQPNVLIRGLLRTIADGRGYDADKFLESFRDFFLTPGANTDTYFEVYVRRFFEALSDGKPLRDCACDQKDVWSIASHSSLQGVLVIAAAGFVQGLTADDTVKVAVSHHRLTHKGVNIEHATAVVVPAVFALLSGEHVQAVAKAAAAKLSLPKIRGDELVGLYRSHHGPGRIPKDRVWELHTEYRPQPFDVEAYSTSDRKTEDMIGLEGEISTMCYTEHGVPATLLLLHRYSGDFIDPILANIMVGGDSTGRGVIVGALKGASTGFGAIPAKYVDGLADIAGIGADVEAFLDVVFGEDKVF